MFIVKNRLMEEGTGEGGGEGPTLEQLQAQLKAVEGEKASMAGQMDKLLGETKAAKEESRLLAEKALVDTNKTKAKLERSGDYESLYKSAMSELEKERFGHDGLKNTIATEKRNNAAMKVATELADGKNAELLSEFLSKRLKFTDEGMKVTDSGGAITISTLDDLKAEFKNDPLYTSLLKGNQSSGGGATGGSNGGGAAKTLTRAEFEALNPIAAAKFMKEGGSLTS